MLARGCAGSAECAELLEYYADRASKVGLPRHPPSRVSPAFPCVTRLRTSPSRPCSYHMQWLAVVVLQVYLELFRLYSNNRARRRRKLAKSVSGLAAARSFVSR